MWNNRPRQLLLVRVSLGGWRRFVIPVPIFVLDLTLAAFSDLAAIIDSFVPGRLSSVKRYGRGKIGEGQVSFEGMLQLTRQLLREWRKYGRWRMVEVQTGKVRLFVDFY